MRAVRRGVGSRPFDKPWTAGEMVAPKENGEEDGGVGDAESAQSSGCSNAGDSELNDMPAVVVTKRGPGVAAALAEKDEAARRDIRLDVPSGLWAVRQQADSSDGSSVAANQGRGDTLKGAADSDSDESITSPEYADDGTHPVPPHAPGEEDLRHGMGSLGMSKRPT